jgi:hypothetical protein
MERSTTPLELGSARRSEKKPKRQLSEEVLYRCQHSTYFKTTRSNFCF